MTPEGLRAFAEGLQKIHARYSEPDEPEQICTYHACDDWPCDAYRAASALLVVMEIHKPMHVDEIGRACCAANSCESLYPCETVRALCAALGEGGEG